MDSYEQMMNEREELYQKQKELDAKISVSSGYLLGALRKFVRDNPELYDSWFKVPPVFGGAHVVYQKRRKGYRVSYDYYCGDSLERVVMIVPDLLLKSPAVYKEHRIKDLAKKAKVAEDILRTEEIAKAEAIAKKYGYRLSKMKI